MDVLVVKLWGLACFLVIQGSASELVGEGTPDNLANASALIDISLSPVEQPIGATVEPPSVMPPLNSPPTPEMPESPISSTPPIAPSVPPSHLPVPPPTSIEDPTPATPPMPPPPVALPPPAIPIAPPPEKPDANSSAPVHMPPVSPPENPQQSAPPPIAIPPPVPIASPLNKPDVPTPPSPDQGTPPESNAPPTPVAPVSPPTPSMPQSPPPYQPVLPEEPPSLPPEPDTSVPPAIPRKAPPPVRPSLPLEPPSSPPEQSVPPTNSRNVSPPIKPPLPVEPPSSSPEQNAPPALAPPPSTSSQTAVTPLPAPPANRSSNSYPPVSHSPSKGPPPNSARNYNISPSPSLHVIPPTSSKPAHMNHSKSASTLPHDAPPPTSARIGTPTYPIPSISPSHSPNGHISPTTAPSTPPPSGHSKISPKFSPPVSSPTHPKMRSPPPPAWQALPPPPPQKDCAPLICTDPLTYGPPEYPCVCVLPIQVGLRLSVALYTFFPLVSELATEIAAGVFMKQSQVRIMGANSAEDNPDKTIVLVDLVPVGQKFDDTTAYLTFERLWQKQVPIKPSIFGDYDVLYVKYPGLPPSPPLPPSTTGVISKPYPGHSNEPLKPIGVDARGKRRNGPTGTIMATILLSAFVAAILLCVIAWILLFRHRDCVQNPDPTPPNTARSLAKSSAMATSMIGSGPSSPAFSLGSSIVAYSGSAKTFSSSDIETATDNFDETRVLGEGGFGRVYSGVLEDGTKIAVKILKRYDQQGNREFLAEVEMLTRLHHRNLVKLIGICIEPRTRCLVYELITNGSVESHLHGIDKEAAPLDWSARLKIALGAARALAYLHEDSSPRVIHRDFKASNILLEDDFTPKVSDFGLARTALDGDNKHISTRVMGTFGYVAPEYAMTGHLLVKSDVYSYGVVLLELLTGRKPVDMSQPPGQENLVAWARPLLATREGLESMIDPILGPDFPFDSIAKVSAIASMCVQPEVSHRPFMGEVVQALKLVSNECDKMKELLLSRNTTLVPLDMEARSSTYSEQTLDHLLNQSPASSYDYRLDCERDLTMSELLSSSAQYDRQDSGSYRRHSSSGPIRMGRTKQMWKTIGRLSGGTVSEHGVLFRLWPGSH